MILIHKLAKALVGHILSGAGNAGHRACALDEIGSKDDKYIAAKELVDAKCRRRGRDDHKRKEPNSKRAKYKDEVKGRRSNQDTKRRANDRHSRTPPHKPDLVLPPLTTPVVHVLMEIKNEEFLKEQIIDLIKRGYLKKYIANRPCPDSLDRRYGDNRPATGDIQVIHGGFRSGVCSSSSQKRHAKSANVRAEGEVYNLSMPLAIAHQPITFTNDDLRGLHLPYDDTLVISATITNFNIKFSTDRPDISGRLLKWSIELREFYISYRPRMAIKAQALAKFIAEFTHDVAPEPEITLPDVETLEKQDHEDDLAIWKLFVDGSSNQKTDALANLALAFDFISDMSIPLEFLPSSSIDVAKNICEAIADPTWLDDIIAYLQDRTLPLDKL
ncbi:hypothetical protein Acr_21g0003350 [Actinidia rufa]|uniref:Uncharacterized protein n=1 Tax=Actinidia rufa TaxID=165716 RepID=A0A7J0GG07_9ERIC|nr:hypothetical protein Acr_21g0003350 [Actinidia rufa]